MGEPPFNPFSIDWNSCSTGRWDKLLAACKRPNLLQTWQYGAALFATERCRIDSGVIHFHQKPIGIVQVEVRPLLWLFRHCAIWRGPIWVYDEIPGQMQRLVFNMLRRRYSPLTGAWLSFNPELTDTPENRQQMRDAGFTYRSAGYQSIWLDIARQPEAIRAGLDQKWRNALVQAERMELSVRCDRDGRRLDDFLEAYEADKAEKGYRGPSPALMRVMAKAFRPESGAVLIVEAWQQSQVVAAVLFVRHGPSATYLIGWTSEAGRAARAHNLLLWHGIVALREAGVSWLDLGGLNDEAEGIARFKRGLGGEEFTLVGGYA